MMSYYSLRSQLLAGCMLAACWAGPALAQDASPAAQPPVGIAELVVTAQRRAQSIQDVPISISALDQEALTMSRFQNVRDLNSVSPNLQVRTVTGGSSLPAFTLRGLYSFGAAPGQDRGVGVYLDGVFLGASSGSISDIADVERIEVLRGPQGTLFGRNSTGGAISIIRRNPTGEFGVHQELSYGNFDQIRSRTRIDLPEFAGLSAAVTYTHDEFGGDIRNLGGGTILDLTAANRGKRTVLRSPDHLNGRNSESVSGVVKWDVTDGLTVTYRGDYSESKFTQANGVVAYVPEYFSTSPALAALLPYFQQARVSPFNGIPVNPASKTRPEAINNALTAPLSVSSYGHNLTLEYAISDQLAFKTIAADRVTKIRTPTVDNAGTFANPFGGGVGIAEGLPGLSPAISIGKPAGFFIGSGGGRFHQWSVESQLVGTFDFATITVGVLHYSATDDRHGFGTFRPINFLGGARPTVQGPVFNVIDGAVIFPDLRNIGSRFHTNSDAIYAQGEFHVTDTVDLVVGGRNTWDKKTGLDNQEPLLLGTSVRYLNNKFTWLAGVNWQPTKDILTYAKYSTGFISGGVFATRAYEPETAKSAEVGIKADWLERRLRTNLSAFRVEYGNQQIGLAGFLFPLPSRPGVNHQSAQVIVNAGDARAWGFELETTLVPVERLTLTANLGYTNFKYTRLSPVIVNVIARDLAGNTVFLPNTTPKFSGNFSAQYETLPLFAEVTFKARLDANYASKHYLSNSPLNDAYKDAITVRNSWIVNGRASLSNFKFGGATADLSIWGRNLFDNKKLSYAANFGPLIAGANYNQARTYGIDLTIDF